MRIVRNVRTVRIARKHPPQGPRIVRTGARITPRSAWLCTFGVVVLGILGILGRSIVISARGGSAGSGVGRRPLSEQ